MKLSMGSFQVNKVEPGRHTAWENGTLFINMEELKGLILKDDCIADVAMEVVYPGEKTRIIHILDAVEPRVKVEGPSACFPGLLGPAQTVGSGRTHRLSGMAVLGVGLDIEPPSGLFDTGVLTYSEGFIDMSGPVQHYCACGDTINVCLCFTVRKGCSHLQFDQSTRLATLKTADYLARSTMDLKAPGEEVYELSPVDPDLPRVAYINQIHSQGFLVRTLLYGLMLPSGNDAATALGRHVGKSLPAQLGQDPLDRFIALMNQKAVELGMMDTHFATPHGLDAPDHYSTAVDMVNLARYARRNPTFCELVSTVSWAGEGHEFHNLNRLLTTYPGCNGVKTGFTDNAGLCLIFSASRYGHRLIGMVLDADKWYEDSAKLLDYGFSVDPDDVVLND